MIDKRLIYGSLNGIYPEGKYILTIFIDMLV